jgi:hypothetical protein
MSDAPDEAERSQQANMFDDKPTFPWQTTLTSLTDTVKLVMPPNQIVPIIFVPGIMGSNLQGKDGKPVWLLNKTMGAPPGLAAMWARKGPGPRQKILHPLRTSVYSGGNVPSEIGGTVFQQKEYSARGWGEVGETSYHGFLLWIEKMLNGQSLNPADWPDFSYTSVSATPAPGQSAPAKKLFPRIVMAMNGLPAVAEVGDRTEEVMLDDLLKRAKCRFPVYACGYNWLQSNKDAAALLAARIKNINSQHNKGIFHCQQVILVTHSMGGLVARACTMLDGMSESIVGIVHGVMPATGAAVAYRRCKLGMHDEDIKSSLVIGSNGQEVTAVFAQAPGALQLLPSENYRREWLVIKDEKGKVLESLPKADPYTEIYLRKDRGWGLVEEKWLSPKEGTPIEWDEFETNIELARSFHRRIAGTYHKNTFVFYGAGTGEQASFETVQWQIVAGLAPKTGSRPALADVMQKEHKEVRESGRNPIYVGGKTEYVTSMGGMGATTSSYETSFWEIRCGRQDGAGDGTVPASSGAAPRAGGGIHTRQQFGLTGFSHEPAYQDAVVQKVTHYAITKLAPLARMA